jgi:pimeloyl-ACP methyl ester carboxylesterase
MSLETLAAPAGPTRVDGDPDRVGLLLPGVGYAPDRPLLHFARGVLVSLGWTAQEVWWPQVVPPERAAQRDWVDAQLLAALAAESARNVIVVGKSLGTFGARVAAERKLPAIWLTPALNREENVADLRRASAPTLLVGSTGDRSWVPQTARALERDCPLIAYLEFENVDHALETKVDPVNSVEVLKRVVLAMERFVGDQVHTV